MSGYVFPCPTNGRCRQILMEEVFKNTWYTGPAYGRKRIHGVLFKCCTQCHLPVSKRESERLNRQLGYTPNDIEIDSDFLDLLNGIE